ncbi:MAG: PilZ domain-containing protein [Planctomycetes bacterium]|nr:PilZ domain-containing protein [Planctomycetota bacterium]
MRRFPSRELTGAPPYDFMDWMETAYSPDAPSGAEFKHGFEARRNPRRKVEGYVLGCYRSTDLSGVSRLRHNIGLDILDIGAGGARLRLSEPVERSTSLTLQIKESGTEELFHAVGDVTWVEAGHSTGRPTWTVGVQFDEIFTPLAKRDRFFFGKGAESRTAPPPAKTETVARPAEKNRTPGDRANVEPPKTPVGPSGRKAERFQIDDHKVTVTRAGPFWSLGRKRNLAVGVVNLSMTGAQIQCVEELKPGTQIQFSLHLTKFADTFQAEGTVVRTWKKPPAWYAGIRFELVEARQQKLLDYMASWFTSHQARFRKSQVQSQGPKRPSIQP